MKKTLKTTTWVVMVLTMTIACSSQKNQTSNQRPSGQQGPPSAAQLISEMDTNKDGKLSKSEVKGPLANDFSKIDSNSDGFLTQDELKNAPGPQRNGRQ
ncbi:MAG: hypothetical protein ABJ004_07760 [Cyclobacteriaceae bacterium]